MAGLAASTNLTTRDRRSAPAAQAEEVFVAATARFFTRVPKAQSLIERGVPVEVLPTYLVLCDHANNKNGLCWPKMETMAKILGRSVRTVQRHLHLLRSLGLVDFLTRRRNRGRFSSYLFRVVHFVELIRRKKGSRTTGHARPVGDRPPIFTGTRDLRTTPKPPQEDPKNQAPQQAPPEAEEAARLSWASRRQKEARRRREGYEWLFGE
jgi:hypothetical protein